ncbi:MAG: hypothetical protein LBG99_07400 [Propionibacteriaceae bacterium]|jgi:glycosidase|nr:hypothetical protein [Propionibacteriaceae bacterium]
MMRRARKPTWGVIGIAFVMILGGCAQGPQVGLVDEYRNYYQIFVGSFADSDGNGLGDLNGITEKLDYIRYDLGVDGIWLTPINPSPTYHKYDVTNYKGIDPQFGTILDFRRFLEEAHERGIRVLIDLVIQHTSWEHPWFTEAIKALKSGVESPYVDYYYFGSEPHEGYAQYKDTNIYYDAEFVAEMPDLNVKNPVVREEIASIVEFWLNEGVDGFRLDATTHLLPSDPGGEKEFFEWLNATCTQINPDAYLVGEAWTWADRIVSYYESGIPSFFNYPFYVDDTINTALQAKDGATLATAIEAWNQRLDDAHPSAIDAPFISNHDINRPASHLAWNLTRGKLSAAIYLLMPGNPFIYYGEEIGMVGSGIDQNKRMPMVWSTTDTTSMPNPPHYADYDMSAVVGVDVQREDPGSLLNFYHEVLELKVKYPAIARGKYAALDTERAILGWRSDYNKRVIYVFENLSDATVTQSLTDLGIKSAVTVRDTLLPAGDDQIPTLDKRVLTLPPYTVAVVG